MSISSPAPNRSAPHRRLPVVRTVLAAAGATLALAGCGLFGSDGAAEPASTSAGCVADLDNGSGDGIPDGGVDINDLLYFLLRFEAGC